MAFFAAVLGFELLWALVAAALVYLVVSPLVFRYSRVLWVYLDQRFDPGR
jgi:hypothetical protein